MWWISVVCMAGAILFGCCSLSAEDVAVPCNSGAGAPPKMRALSLTETSEALGDAVDVADFDLLYEDSPLPSSPDMHRQGVQPSTSSASGLDTPALDEAECDWYAKLPDGFWDKSKPAHSLAFISLTAAHLGLELQQKEREYLSEKLFPCKEGVSLQACGFVWANDDCDPDHVYRKKVLIAMLLHYKKYFDPSVTYAALAYDASLLALVKPSDASWLGKAIAACHQHMLDNTDYSLVKAGELVDPADRATLEQCHQFFRNEAQLTQNRDAGLVSLSDTISTGAAIPGRVGGFITLLKFRLSALERAAFFADRSTILSVVLDGLKGHEGYVEALTFLRGGAVCPGQ